MTTYPVQKAAIRAWVLTMARFGGDPEASLAAAGLSYPAIAGRGTVSWEAFRVFLAHSTAEKAPAEIESMGAEYTAVFPGLQALAGMLIPVDTLYHTTWAAERLWPMVVPVWTADGANYLFEYTLRDGVAPSEAFAHATTGLLRGLSRRLGLPEAEVEVLHLDGRRALWRVRLPPQRLLYRRDGGPAEVFRWAAAGLRMGPRSSVPTSEIAGDAPSVATLASAHQLTLTEARIARHLAAGVPLSQTGKDLGLKSALEIESMGAEYTAVFPPIQAVAGLLVPVGLLYRLTWQAEGLWPMFEFSSVDEGSSLFLEQRLRDGAPPLLAHFHATTGLLRAMSRRLGLPEAEVEVVHLSVGRALWRVRPPPQRLLYRRDGGSELIRAAVAGLRRGKPVVSSDAPSVATLASAHQLTLTEARIARHLAAGVPLAQTRKDLGLKASVVRGHLPEILGKLGAVDAPWAARVRGVLEGAQP